MFNFIVFFFFWNMFNIIVMRGYLIFCLGIIKSLLLKNQLSAQEKRPVRIVNGLISGSHWVWPTDSSPGWSVGGIRDIALIRITSVYIEWTEDLSSTALPNTRFQHYFPKYFKNFQNKGMIAKLPKQRPDSVLIGSCTTHNRRRFLSIYMRFKKSIGLNSSSIYRIYNIFKSVRMNLGLFNLYWI